MTTSGFYEHPPVVEMLRPAGEEHARLLHINKTLQSSELSSTSLNCNNCNNCSNNDEDINIHIDVINTTTTTNNNNNNNNQLYIYSLTGRSELRSARPAPATAAASRRKVSIQLQHGNFLVLTESTIANAKANAKATLPSALAMPHSHSSSHGSSVERVYYDSRREARKREGRTSGGRREVIVHNHKRPAVDEPRRSDMAGDKWK